MQVKYSWPKSVFANCCIKTLTIGKTASTETAMAAYSPLLFSPLVWADEADSGDEGGAELTSEERAISLFDSEVDTRDLKQILRSAKRQKVTSQQVAQSHSVNYYYYAATTTTATTAAATAAATTTATTTTVGL